MQSALQAREQDTAEFMRQAIARREAELGHSLEREAELKLERRAEFERLEERFRIQMLRIQEQESSSESEPESEEYESGPSYCEDRPWVWSWTTTTPQLILPNRAIWPAVKRDIPRDVECPILHEPIRDAYAMCSTSHITH